MVIYNREVILAYMKALTYTDIQGIRETMESLEQSVTGMDFNRELLEYYQKLNIYDNLLCDKINFSPVILEISNLISPIMDVYCGVYFPLW